MEDEDLNHFKHEVRNKAMLEASTQVLTEQGNLINEMNQVEAQKRRELERQLRADKTQEARGRMLGLPCESLKKSARRKKTTS